jgi:hypothetical protein
MKYRSILIIVIFSCLNVGSGSASEPVLQLSKKWLNLLYYEKTKDGYRSHAENDSFFFTGEKGRTDPQAEYLYEVEYFQKDIPASDRHPQCLFPARYELLRTHEKLAPPVQCGQLREWTHHYVPTDIVLVYASQYLSNPASAMGHTFLLIPSQNQTRGFWLTYNYAASIPKDVSGFHYVWGGLTGSFMGDYSVMPLYQRLEQYSAIENRDLWFYTIRTSDQEKKLFILHLWELVHNSHFRYYFTDENCAGILLRTFAAVFDDMEKVNQLGFQVAPIEVVRNLRKFNRIEKFEFFPSQTNRVRLFLDQMSHQERKEFYEALDDSAAYKDSVDSSPRVSEALLLYLNDQRHRHKGVLPSELKTLERFTVQKRTLVKEAPLNLETKTEVHQAPHLSHESSQWSLGVISQYSRKEQLELGYRFTFHSLLDPDAGYLKNSSMELMKIRASIQPSSIRLKQLTIVQIQNYQPYLKFDPHYSWRVSTGLEESILNPSSSLPFSRSSVGYGLNRELYGQYAYFFLAGDINLGGSKRESLLELGPQVGGIFEIGNFKIHPSVVIQQGLIRRTPGWHLRIGTEFQWNITVNSFLGGNYRREELLSSSVKGEELALRFGKQF